MLDDLSGIIIQATDDLRISRPEGPHISEEAFQDRIEDRCNPFNQAKLRLHTLHCGPLGTSGGMLGHRLPARSTLERVVS
jgi:hypothetical protein